MSRPFSCRRVGAPPSVRAFGPLASEAPATRVLRLPLDGLEALRLVDAQGLDQAEAAARVGVSRQTLGRILAAARRTVARALVDGLAVRITDEPHLGIATSVNVQELLTARRREGRPFLIAVGAGSPDLDGLVDPQFGRAAGFLIAQPDGRMVGYSANDSAAAKGAGIAAAEALVRAGIGLVLTGSVGANALQALAAADIAVAANLQRLTVAEALSLCAGGSLEILCSPFHEREPT